MNCGEDIVTREGEQEDTQRQNNRARRLLWVSHFREARYGIDSYTYKN
ncbi:unnamed protein product [Haemonchus placei]|uniref:Uncharacterized protein n=1 Tax=Haemonchus placei TaxID=6290 RepID=A0A3P7Z5L6_HAEPC|nr:unnamed protein product [Haemonchus placei]